MPKNIKELRSDLCQIFDDLKAEKIDPSLAKAMVGAAGQILGSVKSEMEYAKLREERPVIEFLGGDVSPEERAKG